MRTNGVELEKEAGQLLTCGASFHSNKKQLTHEKSPIMGTTITLKRLKQRGYISMQELYEQLNPSFHEPLYT
jgi:hypothetical protein